MLRGQRHRQDVGVAAPRLASNLHRPPAATTAELQDSSSTRDRTGRAPDSRPGPRCRRVTHDDSGGHLRCASGPAVRHRRRNATQPAGRRTLRLPHHHASGKPPRPTVLLAVHWAVVEIPAFRRRRRPTPRRGTRAATVPVLVERGHRGKTLDPPSRRAATNRSDARTSMPRAGPRSTRRRSRVPWNAEPANAPSPCGSADATGCAALLRKSARMRAQAQGGPRPVGGGVDAGEGDQHPAGCRVG